MDDHRLTTNEYDGLLFRKTRNHAGTTSRVHRDTHIIYTYENHAARKQMIEPGSLHCIRINLSMSAHNTSGDTAVMRTHRDMLETNRGSCDADQTNVK